METYQFQVLIDYLDIISRELRDLNEKTLKELKEELKKSEK